MLRIMLVLVRTWLTGVRGWVRGLRIDTALISRNRRDRVGARKSSWNGLVWRIDRSLLRVALLCRGLVPLLAWLFGVVWNRMRRCGNNGASRQRLDRRSGVNWRCNRGRTGFGYDLFTLLIDQDWPIDRNRHWMRNRASDDRALRRCDFRPGQGLELLRISRIDVDGNITNATPRCEIVAANRGDIGLVDVGDVGDVHHVHVRALNVDARRFADICYVDLVDVARAAAIPRTICFARAQWEPDGEAAIDMRAPGENDQRR